MPGKRKRTSAYLLANKYARGRRGSAYARRSTVPRTLQFVPRSLGTPLAMTEHKYFDSQRAIGAITVIDTSWAGGEADPATLNTLFAPVTGNDFLNRIGRKVLVKSIRIKGMLSVAAQANQTATDAGAEIRLILVQDKQTNISQLNAEDVINSGDTTQAVHMFRNPAFFGRFKILKDKTYIMNPNTLSYDGTNMEQSGMVKPFKIVKKFGVPVAVHFNATNGGTVADIIDNSFHVICITNNGDLAPGLQYKCRTMFVDV